jgi:hypothetical protein
MVTCTFITAPFGSTSRNTAGGAARPMSPIRHPTIAQGCDSGKEKQQSTLLQHMFTKNSAVSSPSKNVLNNSNHKVGQQNHHKNNSLTQQTFYSYFTLPPAKAITLSTPPCPSKAATCKRYSFPLSLNLYTNYISYSSTGANRYGDCL